MKPLSRQSRIVLDHLRSNAHLTSWQAEGVYRIRRLASRVDELRAAGYEIETSTAMDATGQRYTRYALTRRQRRNSLPLGQPRKSPSQFRIDTVAATYLAYCKRELDMDGAEAAEEVEAFTTFLKEFA